MHEWAAAGLLLAELEYRSAVAGLDGSEWSRLRYAQSRWWMGFWSARADRLLSMSDCGHLRQRDKVTGQTLPCAIKDCAEGRPGDVLVLVYREVPSLSYEVVEGLPPPGLKTKELVRMIVGGRYAWRPVSRF